MRIAPISIGALTHAEMMTLLKGKVIDLDLFDERSIHEVTGPVDPKRRYFLCHNPQTARRESDTRLRMDRDRAAPTLSPKTAGTRVLERLFAGRSLDFLVLCSSLSSVIGNQGQVDYCAANAYLDAFAERFFSRYRDLYGRRRLVPLGRGRDGRRFPTRAGSRAG